MSPYDRCSVLVVEDDTSTAEFVEAVLRDDGYQVEIARDGVEALQNVERARPDVVLLDLLLPVMGGQSFMQELRRRRGRSIPVIIMTAAREPEPEGPAQAEGLLLKPFELGDLLEEVRRVLGARVCEQ